MSPDQSSGRAEETQRDADVEAAFFLPFLRPGMALLDAGCGRGLITLRLAQCVSPGHVTGVDSDPARVETASSHAGDAGVEDVEFLVADVNSLPFEDGRFDAVFANGLIEHLPDPRVGLAELRRVLKPDGIIGVRSPDWGSALLHPETRMLQSSIALRNQWQSHRGGHPEAGRRLRGLLIEAGFLDVSAGASAESHGTDAGTTEGARYMHAFLGDPELANMAREHGWASANDIEEMRRAWTEWAAQPGAFSSFFWCHATGRAPGPP